MRQTNPRPCTGNPASAICGFMRRVKSTVVPTRLDALGTLLGLVAVMGIGTAHADWEKNDIGTWLTDGTQTHPGDQYLAPFSAIICSDHEDFFLAIDTVRLKLLEPNGDGFQSTQVSLRVAVEDNPVETHAFTRNVSDGLTYFVPNKRGFLSELKEGARTVQIEYPLESGDVIHTYNNLGLEHTPCDVYY